MREQTEVEVGRPAGAGLADQVHYSLSLEPRQLPPHLLYDTLGSSLFDAICHLPWYGVTRAELRLLDAHAPEIGRTLDGRPRIIELGCGNGEKLATLLAGFGRREIDVDLIDVSASALARSRAAVERPQVVRVTTHEATYDTGLVDLASGHPYGDSLVLLLGSNIGNFDPPDASALLQMVRGTLGPGDGLLLGVDLVKPERDLLLAYDDPLGLTAAFNKNLLVRLNAELGANFDLAAFGHRAVWNAGESRVEMHMVSRRRQAVKVPRAGLEFVLEVGETIWTESSYKYEPAGISALVEPVGFARRCQWVDATSRFALTLFEAR
jgi:dimethylhistidine N-methyltransferase